MTTAPRALIVGLGLIGGSIGIALRRSGWRIAYVDPHVPIDDARRAGAADDHGSFAEPGDLTIIATPVDAAMQVLPLCNGVVTSACSVMAPLRSGAPPILSAFVAGHPLAGSAQRGLNAASGDLFKGNRWFVDAGNDTVDRAIADCGAVRVRVDAETHDAAIALTSHLPQLLSTALAAYLDERGDAQFGGTGLATFLRLAESDASVWRPIFEANSAEIEKHIEPLVALIHATLAGDDRAFEAARHFVRRLRDVASSQS